MNLTTEGSSSQQPTTDPIIDPKTKVFKRAFEKADDAMAMAKKLKQDNWYRVNKSAAIMKQYGDPQPWSQAKLKEAGEGWRRNACTGFFSSNINRAIVPYKQAIDTMQYLSNSKLKDQTVDGQRKSELFQEEFTRHLRSWVGWTDFTWQIAFEDLLMGYLSTLYTDEYSWEPIMARGDEIFFPDGTPNHATGVSMFAYSQKFLIHELAEIVANKFAADAGWFVENVVESLNAAHPLDRKSNTPGEARQFEDTIRETSLASTYQNGVKVVEALHMYAQEANGKVSHWIFDEKNNKCLFTRTDRFESMQDCLALMTMQVGNSKLYGSKGAGRTLYNTAIGVEQTRNLTVDNFYLASLIWLKASQKGKKKAAIVVQHPVCVVGDDYTVEKVDLKVNVEDFMKLDQYMQQIAEMQIGTYMPQTPPTGVGGKPTASEINYRASIEQQLRDGALRRFVTQFLGGPLTMIQRRVYSADNILKAVLLFTKEQNVQELITPQQAKFLAKLGQQVDPQQIYDQSQEMNAVAVDSCVRLLRAGLLPVDLFELGQQSAGEMSVGGDAQAQGISQVAAKYAGNPNVNQPKIIQADIAGMVGHELADDFIIPQEDNTLQVEATRMQMLEMAPLVAGEPVPISPRDIHSIHMDVITSLSGEMLKNFNPKLVTPQVVAAATATIAHYDEHLQAEQGSKTASPDDIKKYMVFSKEVHKLLDAVQMPNAATQLQSPGGGATPAAQSPMPAGPGPMPDETQSLDAQQATNPQPIVPSEGMPLTEGPIPLAPQLIPRK